MKGEREVYKNVKTRSCIWYNSNSGMGWLVGDCNKITQTGNNFAASVNKNRRCPTEPNQTWKYNMNWENKTIIYGAIAKDAGNSFTFVG